MPSVSPSLSQRPTDLCPLNNTLKTTFDDGTGGFGALFDTLAEKDIILTGIDLNVSAKYKSYTKHFVCLLLIDGLEKWQ